MSQSEKNMHLYINLMAVGCQKETIVEPNTGMQQTMSVRFDLINVK